MKNFDPSRALAIAAGLVIIALTVAAFWLSYAHLAEVALGHGLEQAPVRAWAWPATLDLFIVAGELLMLRSALARRVDLWAIGLTVVGSGGSIALNVAGVGSAADPLDYVVAAVPPTAALLAFGALMRQIHQAIAGHAEQPPVTAPVTVERADEDVTQFESPAAEVVNCSPPQPVIELPAAGPVWDDFLTIDKASKVTAAVPAETPRQVVTEVVTITPAELRRRARTYHQQVVSTSGRGATIKMLQDEFGISRREATDLRRELAGERS
ncbi:DUF2637 domain-containing protein [Streptomyces sp. NPDC051219]|uniref:DUF2637 domain-containing protein n=1 Tax=Streptomyces sp. NPDC051219 TaxID=3155283 RepID=UPI0034244DCD